MRAKLKNFNKIWLTRILSLSFALAIAFSICQFSLDYLEFFTYDLRMAFKPAAPVSGFVQTVSVDPETLKALKHEPNLNEHAQAIKNLLNAQPRALVYILDPTEIEGDVAAQQNFADAAKKTGAFFFAANDLPPAANESLMRLKAPLDSIEVLPAPRTTDKTLFAKDGVTRRFIFSYEKVPTLHPMLAWSYNGLKKESDYKGLFDFLGTEQGYIDFRPTGTYQAVGFIDALNNKFDPNSIKDKIVIIGRDTVESAKDYIMTPYSREINAMSNLEMHANIFDTLILNRSPLRAPHWLNLLITCLIAVFTLYVVITLRPARGLLLLGLTLSGFSLTAYTAFAALNYWIDMAHPLLAIFICYYFFIPYRLIMENRKSWEYYQKNKLLTQVEELKSNFLRMMSHDLKTPLARIQGMASVVLSEGTELSESQRKALENITESSEELSDFIGSILNLGRIESKEIKLHLKSKDINTLLTAVIRKCEYLAKRKNITIISELEPMFSLKIDEDLLRQVFTNLIENAIKYSPENSKILVSTEEIDGKISVQVADQGIGIPQDEIDNVFTKFYRSRELKNSDIAGSGLGLYLANYFVKLHNGRIAVESEPQKGSTFTVELPMDLNS